MPDIQGLIFSKDRPLQLDGTLRSFKRHCRDADGVTVRVLYTASTSRNRSLYRQLMREHPEIHFVEEFDFRRDTNFLLGMHEFVLFLVDDCLFVGDFSLAECTAALGRHPDAIGVSLRLGRNTTTCYALNKPQRMPALNPASDALLAFRWPDADCDFGYPLEVSSSIYRAADVRELLAQTPFRNPNTLEAELANRAERLRESRPVLLCPGQSLAFCAPVNLVQQVCGNRAGSQPEMSAGALAEKFADGWRIDVARFDGFVPTGCHQEVELPLTQSAERTPAVSVIIPCYKQAEYLREAVDSVVAQTFTDWELIIVDDGSPDDTAATAEAIIAEHPGRSIGLLRKRNGGLSEARNDGIRSARGAYVLPLDADDMIRPTMLEKTVGLLDSNPDIAIAYTDLTHFGAVDRTIQAAEFDATRISINNQLNYCSLYRYEVWERNGGYRSFHWGYEDWDFWVGCAAAGLRAARIPEPLLLYRVKQASMYTAALAHDGELRARIVLNHPQLYSSERIAEARSLLVAQPEPLSPGAPLVSVIVPTHNRPELLRAALQSILAQTMQDFEIIVVNDAGIDIAPWVRSLDASGRIRVLRHPRNRGLAGARNTGIKAARGKYLAYLDDDDLFYPNHLAVLVEAAEASGKAVAYSDGCQATYSQRDGQVVVERSLVFSGNFEYPDLLVRNRIPVLCVLHRRSCIDKVGGFDESFATHEDWDMWVRMFHHFPAEHVRQTTCEYRVQHNGGSLTNTKRPDFYRTMKIIHARYKRWAALHPGTREAQKKQLSALAHELYKSGRPVDPWHKIRYLLKFKRASARRGDSAPSPRRLGGESLETRAVFSATALTPDLDAASDTGFSPVDNRTSDTTPSFTIQAPGATAVKLFTVVKKRVTEVGTAVAEGSAWKATLGPLANGKYSIAAQAFANGVAGKLSKPLAVEINTSAPAVPSIGIDAKSDSGFKGDRITNLTSPVLSGRGQPGTVVILTCPSVAAGAEQRIAVTKKGNWSFRPTGLANGQHAFTAKSENVFGRESGSATFTITVDNVRPTVVGMRYVGDVNEVEVEFSAPVRGVDVSDFRISAPGFGLNNVPLTDRRIVANVGRVTVHDVSGGRIYRLRMANPEVIGGTFTVRLLSAKSGIVSTSSGNPLLADNAVSVTF